MGPDKELPYSSVHSGTDAYIETLLEFVANSSMVQNLCGGVHILDFMTRKPDLYQTLLPREWRDWLGPKDISEILDLLMRDDIDTPLSTHLRCDDSKSSTNGTGRQYNGHANREDLLLPPPTLLQYIKSVRDLCLVRTFCADSTNPKRKVNQALSRPITVGMRPKKAHEVVNFAAFIDNLTADISSNTPHDITHLVDFGSGQNYLGRALASPLYHRHVVAVESKQSNITGAMGMDVSARLTKKKAILRNKKAFRAGEFEVEKENCVNYDCHPEPISDSAPVSASATPRLEPQDLLGKDSNGRIHYIEHVIQDGNLAPVISQLRDDNAELAQSDLAVVIPTAGGQVPATPDPQLMVISLHSCGNLLHHGLRSLVLNPSVKAVAMVGCCYNLVTERLGPPTYKLPTLRSAHARLGTASAAFDPHGFPMSERLATYVHNTGKGIRLNITARMMAVQAPQNWAKADSDAFFTRHFYRALLQRIFLDRGVVQAPESVPDDASGGSPRGWTGEGQAISIGSLRKTCYSSFATYVRGAIAKLDDGSEHGTFIVERMGGLTDQMIMDYQQRFWHKKHELCVVWSLMAFSAGVVESAIVVDRWLFLKEQEDIGDCWVETAFEYGQSPRNLVVVGIKK